MQLVTAEHSSSDLAINVSGLQTRFSSSYSNRIVNAVNNVSFSVRKGEVLGVVGESGSGKSATAMSLLRLLPKNGQIVGGEVIVGGRDIMKLSAKEMNSIRGSEIGFIPQDPLVALNPLLTVGSQLTEGIRCHAGLDRAAARARAIDLLRQVKITDPELRYASYPHQLSGGMRQRIAGAIGIACNPSVLIADEPTTALDVTIQAQYLLLLNELRRRNNMAIIIITHDLGVVAQLCDRVAVFYGGSIIESGPVTEIFASPRHPYTVGLLKSIPSTSDALGKGEGFFSIPGSPPDLAQVDIGCRFRQRCGFATAKCEVFPESTFEHESERAFRCWHPRAETHIS